MNPSLDAAASPIVRTVTGDVDPTTLGRVLAHEHLIIDSPLVADRWPEIHLTSVDDAVAELAPCVAAGVGTVVDAMPAASGRDVVRLAAIAQRAGVRIITATGLHTAKYYEGQRWTSEEDPETLAALFVADVIEGVDIHDYMGPVVRRTHHRAGLLKVGLLADEVSDRDRRLLEAAAIAHGRTGVPILTHCEGGRGGPGQVAALTALGVPASRIALSHTDKVADVALHRETLATGVNVVYDQGLRQGREAIEGTARLIADAFATGRGDQVLVGTDAARRTLWRVHGGPLGIVWIVTGFLDLLRSVGLGDADIERVLVTTPARVLAFSPPG